MIRVAFRLDLSNSGWLGGLNYYRNLLRAVHNLHDPKIEPIILTKLGGKKELTAFPDIEISEESFLTLRQPAYYLRQGVRAIVSQDLILQNRLKSLNIQVLSHSEKRTSQPTLSWIPDFQHVILPDLFEEDERNKRDRAFMHMCRSSDRIIVSSEQARKDLENFAPAYAGKADVLRFVAEPTVSSSESKTIAQLQEQYSFQGPFFILPNQFWAHKNHIVVVKALGLLKRQGKKILVLATGSNHDARNPQFIEGLRQAIRDNDVEESFRMLGIVPIQDLVDLMHHSVSFLNPSKFEGWSTSVEEAKSLGKYVVLSDIPVHREQAPARSTFFASDDHEALAEALWNVSQAWNEEDEMRAQQEAQLILPGRQREFAERYQSIVLEVARKPGI